MKLLKSNRLIRFILDLKTFYLASIYTYCKIFNNKNWVSILKEINIYKAISWDIVHPNSSKNIMNNHFLFKKSHK